LAGDYDLAHIRLFHRHLFGAIYPWAGEIRTVSIARAVNDVVCLPQHIEGFAADVFGQLVAESGLRGLTRRQFVERLAHYYGEINALHPFRDGNGRAQRSFLRQLANDAGRRLSWANLDPDGNDRASAASLRGDLRPMLDMLIGPQ
jgi:cell filamentation protein